jgi:hypothetical protein
MSVDLFRIQWRSRNDPHEKAGTNGWSRCELAGCPDKFVYNRGGFTRRRLSPDLSGYAVLLGLIVKSRTWVRMLDICIPFSCETNGRISAMNWSLTKSLISS